MPRPSEIYGEVLEQSRTLSFFQAIKILRQADHSLSLRFRATPSLAFPPHEIARVYSEPTLADPTHLTIEVPFLGLYGPSSPLPTFYTERLLRDEESSKNIRDFLDIFNHALITRLLEIRTYTRSLVDNESRTSASGAKSTETTRILLRLGGLVALSEAPAPQDDPDSALLLRIVGLLAFRRGTAREVRYLIGFMFKGIAVEVEEWVPRPITIDTSQVARLGSSTACLGSFLLGRRSIDPSGGIRLILTGIPYEEALELMPGKAQHERLVRLLGLIIPGGLHVELILRVIRGRPMTLGGEVSRIGWTARLGRTGETSDAVHEIRLDISV